MRKLKNALFLLFLGASVILSSCEETGEEPLFIPEFPGAEMNHFDLTTLTPDVNSERVIFQASLNTDDSRITYGFMWYVKPQNNEQAIVHTLPVGEGAHNGTYSLSIDDLPKGVELVVCSYVELVVSSDPSQQIGEELNFGWD